MDIYKNDSDIAIIILHEIYGINQHIKDVCKYYSEQKYDVYCPDLYNGNFSYGYIEKESAYLNFNENVGFRAFHKINLLINEVKNQYRKIFIIGFSVGATIAWLCAESGICDGVICYYGSRIRDYVSITPLCPTLLLFASKDSFDVCGVVRDLNKKTNVFTKIFDDSHGFADKYGGNYSESSSVKAFEMAKKFIEDTK
ncbi:MAG: dienelactone hydrolase family protein [Lachnospiraceae bacterium]|nr:dienelactone hydrolase family protein [Lachnospiraceae bacterium]